MDTPSKQPYTSFFRKPALIALVWAGLIFATSCTVVFTDTIYGWVHRLGFGADFEQSFQRFWEGGGGLLIVKGWHATEFAILFFLCQTTLARGAKLPFDRSLRLAWILALIFAASDEWHQTFVPQRDGHFGDVVIDMFGASLMAVWIARRERRRQSAEQRGVLTHSPEA
jgi:hypothetical protein